ncbi:hypothetical protein P5673_012924 [Acropora cervicornis]|uniref:Uncharacterized protein n=1 Tax=Acropora cervicornis TaxID=6130 RepID=A0AAD9QM80_ACRCE|nr:hypothetical protein P5673_012924 [Acropora cervicornis]
MDIEEDINHTIAPNKTEFRGVKTERDITDDTKDSIVVKPKKLQAVSPKIHLRSIIVTIVTGIFSTETSRSAKARFRRNPLTTVRRALFLRKMATSVILPRTEIAQITLRKTTSKTKFMFSAILKTASIHRDVSWTIKLRTRTSIDPQKLTCKKTQN